jgi:uncharacterized protein (DUF488 family)
VIVTATVVLLADGLRSYPPTPAAPAYAPVVVVFTLGHGTRPVEELVVCLREADVRTLIDVRRFPSSRRHPQFNRDALAAALAEAEIEYRHVEELGGRRSSEAGEQRFACIRTAGFRSYVARMGTVEWQGALASALAEPVPWLMCAETLWWRCHRRLIAELLVARGHTVVHLIRPGERRPHRLSDEAEVREGRLYLCGQPVA